MKVEKNLPQRKRDIERGRVEGAREGGIEEEREESIITYQNCCCQLPQY